MVNSANCLPAVDLSHSLSVQPEESGLVGVPLLLLKETYAQASQLMEREDAIMPKKKFQKTSNNQSAFVIRNDVGRRPYYVYQEENSAVSALDTSLLRYAATL